MITMPARDSGTGHHVSKRVAFQVAVVAVFMVGAAEVAVVKAGDVKAGGVLHDC